MTPSEHKRNKRIRKTHFAKFLLVSLVLLGPSIFFLQRDKILSVFSKKAIVRPLGDPRVTDILRNELQSSGIGFSLIEEERNTIKVILENETIVLFPKEGNLREKVGSLQLLLGRFKIEGKRVKTIDLSFKKPFFIE